MATPDVAGTSPGGRNSAGAFTVNLAAGSSWIAISSCRRTSGGGGLATPPSGWTLIGSNAGDQDNAMAVYHSGSDTPGTSWTAPSNTASASVLIVGFDQATVVDAVSTVTTTLTCATATATVAGTRVCRIMTNNAWNHAAPVASYPAGTSDGAQHFVQNAANNTSDGGSLTAFAGVARATTGAVGTAAYSFSAGSSFAPRSFTVILEGTGGPPPPSEGTAATALGLGLAATGARQSAGTAATALGLSLAATGARESAGTAATAVGLGLAATGARESAGTAATAVGLGLAATGARESAGTAAAGLGLVLAATGQAPGGGGTAVAGLGLGLAATGARESGGSAAAGLGITLAATGQAPVIGAGTAVAGLGLTLAATGEAPPTGQPVQPFPHVPVPISAFPWPPVPVSGYPWPPRPVRSFSEVPT